MSESKMIYKVEVYLVAGKMVLDVEMDSPNHGGQQEEAGQKAIAALLKDPELTLRLFSSLRKEGEEVQYELLVRDVCPVQTSRSDS